MSAPGTALPTPQGHFTTRRLTTRHPTSAVATRASRPGIRHRWRTRPRLPHAEDPRPPVRDVGAPPAPWTFREPAAGQSTVPGSGLDSRVQSGDSPRRTQRSADAVSEEAASRSRTVSSRHARRTTPGTCGGRPEAPGPSNEKRPGALLRAGPPVLCGHSLLSRLVANTLGAESLTTVFGKGTGVAFPL